MKHRVEKQSGFTLIEMVVVLTISAILSVAVLQFLMAPVEAYTSQSRRLMLVDEAQLAVQHLAHDVRLALPNSIRIGCGGSCVEFLRAVSGGRYRASPPGDTLSFVPADLDTSFAVLGSLNHSAGLATSSTSGDCAAGNAACVVVYNTGFDGTDAWRGDNMATLSGFSVSPPSVSFLNDEFSGGQRAFPQPSPGQRFFIVDSPVTYLCDLAGNSLRRYQGYSIRSNQAEVDTHAELIGLGNPAENGLLATRISGCDFQYRPGTETRNGILTVRLSISDGGETITLLEQVHVDNTP